MPQLGYHVSTGQPLWSYSVRQGTVLYLALEDDFPRLQSRLYRMFDAEVAKNFYLSTWAKQTGSGLEEQVEGFVATHADTRLVIIDTLQRERPADGNRYSYASDYAKKYSKLMDSQQSEYLQLHNSFKLPTSSCNIVTPRFNRTRAFF